MTDTRKSAPQAKVVPVHRGKTAATASAVPCQLAWIEGDKRRPSVPEKEPFLPVVARDDSASSGLECERLCEPCDAKVLIFAIDLERGGGSKKKKDRAGDVSPATESTGSSEPGTARSIGSASSTSSSSSSSSSNGDSLSDAKLLDKLRKTKHRKRIPHETRGKVKTTAKLLQLCQCCPWTVPWCLLVVSALQIFVYLLKNNTLHQALIFSPEKQYEVWRFVTYTFLHAGSVHLVLNIIIQILVGFPLETEQGHGKVLLVYFAGILAGGLGASVFEPTLMVGASAGVYCLLISHIPHIIMNFKTLSYRYYRLIAVMVLCTSDVLYSIRHCLTKGNMQPRIGVAAHISGAICGLLIGFAVYHAKEPPASAITINVFRVLRYLAVALLCSWIGATVFYNSTLNNVI